MQSIYPEVPTELTQRGWKRYWLYLGPGAIIASVTIGSGELVWASRSGAVFGYSMLWCFLYAGVFKAIQVYTAARHFTLTGEHPIVTWTKLPGPPMWLPILIAVPAIVLMPIAFSGIPEMLGNFIHQLLGFADDGPTFGGGQWAYREFWVNVWTTIVLTVCLLLAVMSNYTFLERVSVTVLAIMVTCIATAVVMVGVDFGALASGLFIPRVEDFPAFVQQKYADDFAGSSPWLEVSLYLTAVGGGAYDYIGYIGMLRQKKWGLAGKEPVPLDELAEAASNESTREETQDRARRWVMAPLLDTSISFALVVLVTLLFGILGATVLHTQSVVPVNKTLLSEQESFLAVIHPAMRFLYRGGVFLALIGTLYGAFEVYQETFVESLSAMAPRACTPNRVPAFRKAIVAYCYLGGLIVVWLPVGLAGNITQRMLFGSVLTGATACGLWCFAMLWTDRMRLPPELRMGRLLWILTFVAGVAMSVLGVQTIIAYF